MKKIQIGIQKNYTLYKDIYANSLLIMLSKGIRYIVFLFFSLFISSGCFYNPWMFARAGVGYDGPRKSKSEVAIIEPYYLYKFFSSVEIIVWSIKDLTAENCCDFDAITYAFSRRYHLLPGRYEIVLRYTKRVGANERRREWVRSHGGWLEYGDYGEGSVNPTIQIDVKAGYTYKAKYEKLGDNRVRVYLEERKTE